MKAKELRTSRSNEEEDWYWLWESEEEKDDEEDNNEGALSGMLDSDGLTCLISKNNVKKTIKSNLLLYCQGSNPII